MANYYVEYEFQIVDVNGDTALTRVPSLQVDTVTLAAMITKSNAIGAALIACSNGKTVRTSISITNITAQLIVGSAPPTNAEYSSVTDGARLNFANGTGARMSLTVPAPLESDFGPSSNVVNPLDTNVAALIGEIASTATDRGGTLFNLYKGGIKVGKRARLRRSSLVP
jgi:hypothetical protein